MNVSVDEPLPVGALLRTNEPAPTEAIVVFTGMFVPLTLIPARSEVVSAPGTVVLPLVSVSACVGTGTDCS